MPLRPLSSPRLALVSGAALAALLLPAPAYALAPAPGGAPAPAAPAAPEAPAAPAAAPHQRLDTVTELAAERLELADEVAAAKWGTDQPIEAPERERQVLTDVAERAAATGVDPDEARAVFRDQIEANKLVQRGLHTRWEHHPDERPAARPDLAEEVRPALDRITGDLLAALRDTDSTRHSGPACPPRLTVSAVRTAQQHHFDALHAAGLARALPSVCS